MDSLYFYKNLNTYSDFNDIFIPSLYTTLPSDWLILASDIQGSTKAIESGRYKEVNIIGALSIVSVLNCVKNIEVPYIFGGDGATILIPSKFADQAQAALLATKILASETYSLSLRIAMISVSEIIHAGHQLDILKFEVSPHYKQAMILGEGLNFAENIMKKPQGARFLIEDHNKQPKGDFTGLECRWEDIKSSLDETCSIMIKALGDKKDQQDTYVDIYKTIEKLFGSKNHRHAAKPSKMNLSHRPKTFKNETDVICFNKHFLQRCAYYLKTSFLSLLGEFLMFFKIKTNGDDWGQYKDLVSHTTDNEKFDNLLRMVISCTTPSRLQFEQYLESQFKNKKLIYGIHVSDRVLMTCLIFERHGQQVHFVDAADGGYACASVGFKERLHLINKSAFEN